MDSNIINQPTTDEKTNNQHDNTVINNILSKYSLYTICFGFIMDVIITIITIIFIIIYYDQVCSSYPIIWLIAYTINTFISYFKYLCKSVDNSASCYEFVLCALIIVFIVTGIYILAGIDCLHQTSEIYNLILTIVIINTIMIAIPIFVIPCFLIGIVIYVFLIALPVIPLPRQNQNPVSEKELETLEVFTYRRCLIY